ncbi:ABC transporter permease [Clostridium sp. Marseille-P2415]|uniref:ABC transporter permease n=1 Tax=Clostridium sp. Marseille-P2415 TaxID=1805471 RepID=UPI00098857C2|nr:ABC transporter permease [Clostridium sp. Marseille-P2415]
MKASFRARLAKIWKKWEFVLFLIIILEVVVFASKNSKFLLPRVLFGSMNDIISICIISLFVTFVMITGGIDIQAGSIVGLSSIILGVAWQDGGVNIWAASLLAMTAAGLCGALSGFFIAYCGVQPMVVTLGGSFLYTGIALLVSNLSATESYKGISGFPDGFLKLSKLKLFGVIPSQVIIFLILAVSAYFLLHKTRYGRQVFLVGVNRNAAEYSGIHARLIIMSTYILSGISASVAGIILTSYLGTAKSDIGSTLTLPIITAVVLGGTLSTGGKGSVPGTALAAVAIGTLRFGLPLCFKVSQQYLDIPAGLLLLVVVTGRALLKNPGIKARLPKKERD